MAELYTYEQIGTELDTARLRYELGCTVTELLVGYGAIPSNPAINSPLIAATPYVSCEYAPGRNIVARVATVPVVSLPELDSTSSSPAPEYEVTLLQSAALSQKGVLGKKREIAFITDPEEPEKSSMVDAATGKDIVAAEYLKGIKRLATILAEACRQQSPEHAEQLRLLWEQQPRPVVPILSLPNFVLPSLTEQDLS